MRRFLCAVLLIFALIPSACAEEDMFKNQYDALGLRELERNKPEEAEEIELSQELTLNDGLWKLWDRLEGRLEDIFKSGLGCVVVIMAVSILCASVSALGGVSDMPQVKGCISLVGALAVTAASAGSIKSVMGMGSEAIDSINVFSKSLLPTLAAASAACGTPTAALTRATATVFFSDVLITLIKYAFLPLVYIVIFASAADAAAPNESLRRIASLAVKIVSGALKLLLGAFVSYIAVAGIVAGGVDKAGLKTAQFAISGTVPVVGGIISEAAEAVMAGATLIKNTIGLFGMLSILSVCVVPFATLAINYFMFKCAATLAVPVIDSKISSLTDNIGTSFGLMLAMIATTATVMFVSIAVSMYAVGG